MFEMAWRVGAELAWPMMRKVLEDTPVDLPQVSNVEIALNRVQDEFGLPIAG